MSEVVEAEVIRFLMLYRPSLWFASSKKKRADESQGDSSLNLDEGIMLPLVNLVIGVTVFSSIDDRFLKLVVSIAKLVPCAASPIGRTRKGNSISVGWNLLSSFSSSSVNA